MEPKLELDNSVAARDSVDIQAILAECYVDKGKFFKAFLADNFYVEYSTLHQKMLDELNRATTKKKSCVCATRGIGKSTFARGLAAWAILYAEADFIVYIGKSATHAEMQTENLKKDLGGIDIRTVWGSVKTSAVGDAEESWSKKTWVASVGEGENKHYTLVLPRGSLQQVRGLLWKSPSGKNCRPDLIIIDDLEDSEVIENEELRAKRKEWFFADVMKCTSRLENKWWVFYIDTLKHEDALIQHILSAPDWADGGMVLSVCDENYKSLAPDFMSDAEIMEEVEIHRNQGIMDVFAREIMCMATSKEDAAFSADTFRYYNEDGSYPNDAKEGLYFTKFRECKDRLQNIVIYDPAKTAKRQSAETGFVVWGVDLESNALFLRYAAGERLHPEQIENRALDLCQQYNAKVLGVETTGMGEFGSYGIKNEIVRRRLAIELVELSARRGSGEFSGVGGGKKMRISSLIPWYRRGLVYHNTINTGAYETQLIGFPRSKRWDIMDAAAYIVEMLEKGDRFFYGTSSEESAEEVEKEFAMLDDDYGKPLVGWQCI